MSAVNLANIPAELKELRQWCVWRLEPNADNQRDAG